MKTKKRITTFSFWKENRKDGFFQLTATELFGRFIMWLPTKEKAWLEYYGISDCVQAFVGESLNAIGNTENDFEEYRAMEEILKPVRRNYLDKQTA